MRLKQMLVSVTICSFDLTRQIKLNFISREDVVPESDLWLKRSCSDTWWGLFIRSPVFINQGKVMKTVEITPVTGRGSMLGPSHVHGPVPPDQQMDKRSMCLQLHVSVDPKRPGLSRGDESDTSGRHQASRAHT
ncbi:unnamed protein product [Pleuronectes platessa]|uniref:Uncharacterized protein n=1 Tax=Pleuronectes platessa TaxID=8262 RepID=A0A9N7YCW5_PLEPL|nr:unnamed protein product [Pleuronectes platessa]